MLETTIRLFLTDRNPSKLLVRSASLLPENRIQYMWRETQKERHRELDADCKIKEESGEEESARGNNDHAAVKRAPAKVLLNEGGTLYATEEIRRRKRLLSSMRRVHKSEQMAVLLLERTNELKRKIEVFKRIKDTKF